MKFKEFIVQHPKAVWFGKLVYFIARGQLLSVTYKFDLRAG